jgi:hypothetical protein
MGIYGTMIKPHSDRRKKNIQRIHIVFIIFFLKSIVNNVEERQQRIRKWLGVLLLWGGGFDQSHLRKSEVDCVVL